jgi:hypothetical protein
MPPRTVSCSSMRLIRIRSCKGRIFMMVCALLSYGFDFPQRPASARVGTATRAEARRHM